MLQPVDPLLTLGLFNLNQIFPSYGSLDWSIVIFVRIRFTDVVSVKENYLT